MRNQRRGGGGGPPSRAWDVLRDHKLLGVREVRGLERLEGMPEGIELGVGLVHGRPAALVAGRSNGVELLGWAVVAMELARQSGPVIEAYVFAPLVQPAMRRASAWLSESGVNVRLASVPALAEKPSDLVGIESGVDGSWKQALGQGVSESTFERVLRVVEGAAAVTTAGALRALENAHVLYMRGARILRVTPEPEGAAVDFLAPERKQVHVNDANFSRWGPDLFEEIVQLAQDPRLLENGIATREAMVQSAAESANACVVARWMPWSADGRDPIDWIGVDAESRPVLGWVRPTLRLADAPAVISAAFRLETERDLWAPGSTGATRVRVTGQLDDAARELLEGLDLELAAREESPAAAPALAERERERRGRRRSRRRRRGRFEEDTTAESEYGRNGAVQSASQESEEGEELSTELVASERAFERDEEVEEPFEGGEPELEDRAARGSDDERGFRRNRRDRGRGRGGEDRRRDERQREDRSRTDREAPRPELAANGELDEVDEMEAAAELEPLGEPPLEEESEREIVDRVALSAAEVATLDEGDDLEIGESLVDAEELPAPTDEAAPAPRRRRPKAAIAVRNDLDSIVTALVLARERRNVPFFYVCAQHELMDFLRGKATDIDENTDLLLVGFTAQPVPSETIAAAAVYRGQISWFDHHEWPIEDLERLREAIGEDAVFGADGSSSPLAAVMEIAERRSRFTDKLLDFSGRRLSEADMEKWGYNLVGVIQRMTESSGDYRNEIQPVLAGKPSDLPQATSVYSQEAEWLASHEPRLVCFGEYQMAVGHVPGTLDAGEIGRRLRHLTGARMSLASREGDSVVVIGYNEEKRHINVLALLEQLDDKVPWLHVRPSADRTGRVEIEDLAQHPERIEAMIGEIVRHKSVLYG